MLLKIGRTVLSAVRTSLDCPKLRELSLATSLRTHQLLPQTETVNTELNNVNIKTNRLSGLATIQVSNHTIFNGKLFDAISSLETWKEGKGLILHSEGIINNEPINGYDFNITLHKLHNLVECIRTLPLISVYLLNGKCSGMGTDVFLSTDFRVMGWNGEINLDYLNSGLPPLAGGSGLLGSLVGEREALKLLLRKARVRGEEALALGLVEELLGGESGGGGKGGWTTAGQVGAAERWLTGLLGATNENAGVVQALKRIVVARRGCEGGVRGCSGAGRKLEVEKRVILSCLHEQSHLTAMGVFSEPMFAHLQQFPHIRESRVMGGNAKDDFIA